MKKILLLTILFIFLIGCAKEETILNNETGQTFTSFLDEYVVEPEIQDEFPNAPIKHWGHMPLTFFINPNFPDRLKASTRLAFQTIEEETDGIVSFKEITEGEADILFTYPSSVTEVYHPEATATYLKSINNNDIIKSAFIEVYGQGMVCGSGYPALEVHEILHTFSFEHNPNRNSIMYMYTADSSNSCDTTEIEEEYISCLKYVYSNGQFNGNCDNIDTYKEVDYADTCEGREMYEDVAGNACCYKPNMVWLENGRCINKCDEGYILGDDLKCHEECLEGQYCPSGFDCYGRHCVKDESYKEDILDFRDYTIIAYDEADDYAIYSMYELASVLNNYNQMYYLNEVDLTDYNIKISFSANKGASHYSKLSRYYLVIDDKASEDTIKVAVELSKLIGNDNKVLTKSQAENSLLESRFYIMR